MSETEDFFDRLEQQWTPSVIDTMLARLDAIEQGIAALQDAMGLLLEAAAPKPKQAPQPPAAPTPIASYEQMYGMAPAKMAQEERMDHARMDASATQGLPAPPREPRSGLWRWLTKEESV
jgi:hypothetical protein